MANDDYQRVKSEINLVEYVLSVKGGESRKYGNTWRIKPCPICGDNEFKHFNINIKDGTWLWKDFETDNKGSIIDFAMQHQGAHNEKEALDMIMAWANMDPKRISNSNGPVKKETPKKPIDFTSLIEDLHKKVCETDYFKGRGISQEVIDKYKLGYSESGFNYIMDLCNETQEYKTYQDKLKESAKKAEGYRTFLGCFKYFIPIWNQNNRCTWFISRIEEKSKPEWMKDEAKIHNPAGFSIQILNENYLLDPDLTDKYIIIVEGWADCLTLETLGYNSIALNSTSNVEKFLKLAKKNKKNLENKVLIVCGDNDVSGFKMNKDIEQGLKDLSLKTDILIIPKYKDLNQWLTTDRDTLEDHLSDYIESLKNKDWNFKKVDEQDSSPEAFKGVFISNNCYCKYGKENSIKQITNFIIEPLELINIDDRAMELSTNIITREGKKFRRVFSISDLMGGYQKFKKSLQQLLIFDGKDSELEGIKKLILSAEFKNKQGVTCSGFHFINDKWVYVSGDKVIDENINPIDDIVLLKESKRLDTDLLNIEPIKKDELVELSGILFNFNDIRKTATIVGHTSAIFLKEKLWSQNINFNHLLIIGEAGSGKSKTTEYIIKPILGLIQGSIDAGNCTKFAIIKTAASSNTMPFIIDEYKPATLKKFIVNEISEFLRNSYDQHQAIRGNVDQGINEYNMLTPAILIGEDGTDETAIIERSLQVNFSALESKTPEHTAAYDFLKDHQNLLKKLGRALLNEALKMDASELKKKHKDISNELLKTDINASRIINSLANCILGIHLLKRVFNTLSVDFSLTGHSMSDIRTAIYESAFEDLLNENKTSKTAVESTLEVFNRMANPAVNALWEGIHYKIINENELALDVSGIYDIFKKYVFDFKITECENITKNQFTKQLRKTSYFVDYKPVRLHADGTKRSTTIKKVFILSSTALLKRGLELNYLIPSKSDWVKEAATTKEDNVIQIPIQS